MLVDRDGKKVLVFARGLSKLDYLEPKLLKQMLELRKAEVDSLEKIQFELLYHLGLQKSDSDKMTVNQLKRFYELLLKQKQDEYNKAPK